MTALEGAHMSLPSLRGSRPFERSGWWRRAIAWILDAFITAVPVSVIVTFTNISSRDVVKVVHGKVVSTTAVTSVGGELVELVVWLAAQIIYYALFEGGIRGQTIGKRWMGIATVDAASGGPIGRPRAAARAALLSGLLCLMLVPGLIDALWPLFDPQRASLHDRLTRTAVIEVFAQ